MAAVNLAAITCLHHSHNYGQQKHLLVLLIARLLTWLILPFYGTVYREILVRLLTNNKLHFVTPVGF